MLTIKRYPNRKLYDTMSKQYITLEGIAALIREGEEVQVIDHASGEDLTALTLTQIILEQEKKQSGVLSHSVLTGLIRSSGDRLHALQRAFFSSVSYWGQIDEEIKQRIQSLIKQGEITKDEGQKLIDRLIKQGIRQREERDAQLSEKELEAYLSKYQLPTQDDVQQLNAQIEELSAKLEALSKSASAS